MAVNSNMTRQIIRRTTNTPGFVAPPLDHAPAQPDPVERTQPNPRLVEPPPAGQFALRPVENFALVTDPKMPRAVTEADLDELLTWGLPLFQSHYPGATAERMLPLLRRACAGYPYRALRTDAAFGVFMIDAKVWHTAPIVFSLFIGWQEDAPLQAVRICRSAMEWAKSIKASHFELIECFGNLGPIAERLGIKAFTKTYTLPL